MALNEYEIKKMMCDVGKRIYDRNMVQQTMVTSL